MEDGSELYSGVIGNEDLPQAVKEEVEERKLQLQKLLPTAQLVLEILDRERASTTDLRGLFPEDDAPTQKDLDVEIRARKLYLSLLNGLEATIQDGLRTIREET
jgi:hypothetical protein